MLRKTMVEEYGERWDVLHSKIVNMTTRQNHRQRKRLWAVPECTALRLGLPPSQTMKRDRAFAAFRMNSLICSFICSDYGFWTVPKSENFFFKLRKFRLNGATNKEYRSDRFFAQHTFDNDGQRIRLNGVRSHKFVG
jgi:hypothetical protein